MLTDTEGYDLRVLQGAQRMLSDARMRCVICEVGFLDDRHHTPFVDVSSFMGKFGFEIAGFYEFSYLTDYRAAFTNALFVRT